MPARNAIKIYGEGYYYHVYNRGVEKREIFLDDQDYRTFLHLLKIYLSPSLAVKPSLTRSLTRSVLVRPRPIQSVADEVKLVAFCLMPNHFHLLIKQETMDGMTKLLRRISTTYSLYFNDRYQRVGTLFQGRYRAVIIDSEPYLLHLSRYIHTNPAELTRTDLVSYLYSSYPYYLGRKSVEWLDTEPILGYFHFARRTLLKGVSSYQDFVEGSEEESAEVLGSLVLE